MMDDKVVEVTCPKCGIKIKNTVTWFKKPGNCCPGCQLRFSNRTFQPRHRRGGEDGHGLIGRTKRACPR
jgi:hypothetical protein